MDNVDFLGWCLSFGLGYGIRALLIKLDVKFPDPVKTCRVYKSSGCVHVDGILCNPETCKEKLEADMFELEQQLDIPSHLRWHNRNK